MSNQDYSMLDLLRSLAKNKKYILYTTLGAAIIAIVISLLLPVYYKSMTSFYAASPDLGLPNVVGAGESDREVYGSDYDIDRVLSIAESESIYSYLIDSFKLYDHYDIDQANVKAPYYVREELKDMYKVLKTKLGAIELTVEDKDPIFAANMANAARDRTNQVIQALMKGSQNNTLKSYEFNLSSQAAAIESISDSIKRYRTLYKIINTDSQGEVYSELLAKANASYEGSKAMHDYFKETGGRRDSIRKYSVLMNMSKRKLASLNIETESFNSGVSKVQQLVIEYERLINQLAVDRQRNKLLYSAYQSPFSALHIIDIANPPVIKSKPRRSLIVIGATFLAFLFSIGYVLLKNNLRDINLREIWNA